MNTWSDDNLQKKAIPKISHLATERDTQRVEFEGFYRERKRDAEKVEGRVEYMVFRADGGHVVFRGGGVVEEEETE